jgi:hypothetical protein
MPGQTVPPPSGSKITTGGGIDGVITKALRAAGLMK